MTLKLIVFILLTQLCALGIQAQKPTCKSLQVGSFKVTSAESGTTFIKRGQKEQLEKNDLLGYEVFFDIKWLDECTYELRPKKLIKGDPSIMGNGTDFVRTKIKNITAKGYTAETTASFNPGSVDFEVEIINKQK